MVAKLVCIITTWLAHMAQQQGELGRYPVVAWRHGDDRYLSTEISHRTGQGHRDGPRPFPVGDDGGLFTAFTLSRSPTMSLAVGIRSKWFCIMILLFWQMAWFSSKQSQFAVQSCGV